MLICIQILVFFIDARSNIKDAHNLQVPLKGFLTIFDEQLFQTVI